MEKIAAVTELRKYYDPVRAKHSASFFKTGKGEYAQGDIFWGISMPALKSIAKIHRKMPLEEITKLLKSPIHEVRMLALQIMMWQFNHSDESERKIIYKLYINKAAYINNWDLVDVSAPYIVGVFLIDKPKRILYKFARSAVLWNRRIAIISTFAFIRRGLFTDTLSISEILLNDTHDLIHKAVGWMLREVGKRDYQKAEEFLHKHYRNMPRTMLRYAIEKYNPQIRRAYLEGKIK